MYVPGESRIVFSGSPFVFAVLIAAIRHATSPLEQVNVLAYVGPERQSITLASSIRRQILAIFDPRNGGLVNPLPAKEHRNGAAP